MKRLGLIGFPLSHSFSKKYFSEKFKKEHIHDFSYELFPIENINELPAFLKANPEVVGLNVTIPYKISVLPFLDELDETAKSIGAVNTIKIKRTGNGEKFLLKGFNTDAFGFEMSLLSLIKPHHTKALILGNGGAAKAVTFILEKHNISYKIVTRIRNPIDNDFLNYEEINSEILNEFNIIVNTTPLGMSPNIEGYPPIPYKSINKKHLLYDLVYNPELTIFMKKGVEQGATVKNGLSMLIGQAEKAWEIWNKT